MFLIVRIIESAGLSAVGKAKVSQGRIRFSFVVDVAVTPETHLTSKFAPTALLIDQERLTFSPEFMVVEDAVK